MSFDRNLLPDPVTYFEGEGLKLAGRGEWRTTACLFHGGSDSMRINVEHGGWCCMACGAKGGDVLAYAMELHGLDFVNAARSVGAWVDDGKPHRDEKPRSLSAARAMELMASELMIMFVVIADVRAGVIPSDSDWQRFIEGAGRLEQLASEWA